MSTYAGASALSPRDRAVVELVSRFRQITAGHIQATLFADCTSKTPCDRALKRLCERRILVRLSRPVGGNGGGSSQYVYQLGRVGWRLLGNEGSYWLARSVNLHSLAIADCYAQLQVAEQRGQLSVLRFDAEPTCHCVVGDIQLTPDAYAQIGVVASRLKFSLFLEVDRGTERAAVIRDKCVRYWRAYQQWHEEHFPYVMFVVPDSERQQELERTINAGPPEAAALFRVTEQDGLAEVIHRNLE